MVCKKPAVTMLTVKQLLGPNYLCDKQKLKIINNGKLILFNKTIMK